MPRSRSAGKLSRFSSDASRSATACLALPNRSGGSAFGQAAASAKASTSRFWTSAGGGLGTLEHAAPERKMPRSATDRGTMIVLLPEGLGCTYNPGVQRWMPSAAGGCAGSGPGPRCRYRPFAFSQARLYSASSRQPLSMVSECPRPGNSLNSVTAGECRYALSALFTSTGGTVLSFSPETSSSGPRVPFDTLILVAEFGLKVAVAAWNSGRPGAGIAYLA